MSMYTTPVNEQVSFETPEDRALASEKQVYVLDRFIKAASERDEELALFADAEKRAVEGVTKGREARSRQAGWAGKLGCYVRWLASFQRLNDEANAAEKPKNRSIATSGAEFIRKPANHPTKWIPDDEIQETILEAELPDEVMDECFTLTVTVPVTEAQINDARNALAEVGLAISVMRKPDKAAIKKCLGPDGRKFRHVDEDAGTITDTELGRRVMWQDPPSVPDTYKVIAPDGTVYHHDPLDDPEPEGEGAEGEADDQIPYMEETV